MAWGRLDDQANGNAKLLALTDTAFRMWACGLIYCQANLTDGHVPRFAVEAFGVRGNRAKAIQELCAELVKGKGPLWHVDGDGFAIHDYFDWNDSKAQIVKGRELTKARMRRFREARHNGVTPAVTRDVTRDVTVSVTQMRRDDS